jgi:hypothetical protein
MAMGMASPTREAVLPPRLPGVPVLGSALDLKRNYLGTLLRGAREVGGVVRFVAGPPGWRQSLYGVFTPDGIAHVLAADGIRYR